MENTIMKIGKDERDTLARFCIECGIHVNFYTVENNDNLLQAEIQTTSPVILFRLGKMVGMAELAKDLWKQ